MQSRWPSGHGFALAGFGGVLFALLSPPASGQPLAYSAAEIRGWVVDAETKQPLPGVHVVAQWILETGLIHSRHVTRLHILETVTDAKGEYYFPAWGPKPRPTFSRLDTADPQLTFFKPGYWLLDRSNRVDHDNPQRTSIWHSQTVTLEPFRGGSEQWARVLGTLQIRLGWGSSTDEFPRRPNDNWKYFPRIVLAILEERRALSEETRHRVSDLESWGTSEDQVRALLVTKGRSQ